MTNPNTQPGEIDFYFDFISPFGYFASLRIDELANKHGLTVRWRSILLGVSVLKVMGLKPLMETPLKRDYVQAEAARYCRRHGITLRRTLAEQPMNPLPAARLFNWLAQREPSLAVPFAKQVLHSYWHDGDAMDSDEALLAAAGRAGISSAIVHAGLSDAEAKVLLQREVEAALARGVFGSPFFMMDGEPFFGVDKLELIDEWLSTGGW